MCIRVLFIHIHPKVLCKPPMFSKHPHCPKRKCSHAEMCPAIPRSLGGAGSDAWQMSLEGISALKRSRCCGQWDFPSSHTSCTSFLHRWLDLKALAFSVDCVSLSDLVPLLFHALLLILCLCSCGVHLGCWCVDQALFECSSEQLACPELWTSKLLVWG